MDGTRQYDVTCVIRVTADNDDAALFWVQDACQMYPVTEFQRWMFTDIVEKREQ
jgi:hypothetical protein